MEERTNVKMVIEIFLNNKQYHIRNKKQIHEKKKQYSIDNKKRLSKYKKLYYSSHASYETYAHQLTIDEEPRLADDGVSLEVRCKYCGKYFKPKNLQIIHRINSIDGKGEGENNLYCSDNCKNSCSIYNRSKYPKGFKPDTSREVQPALRKLVLERDNWTCQKCGNSTDDYPLHCHHFEGIEINPVESADVDNCVTLCKKCHKAVHKQDGCNMKRERC
jgi:5-methylcytosine-specific restriction endonuclease McrA